jgi:radical SAM protein with 4Fe4S-binding SPASM domain
MSVSLPSLDERVASFTRFSNAEALSERLDRASPRIRECQVLYHRQCAQDCLSCFLGEKTPVEDIGIVEGLCQDLMNVGIRPVVYPSDPLLPSEQPERDRETFARLLRLLQSIRQKIILFTGLEMNPVVLQALRDHGPPKLHLSVHGSNPASHDWFTRRPGSFHEVDAALRLLKCEVPDARLGLNVVLHRRNVHEIEEMVERALRRGVGSLYLIAFKPGADASQELRLDEGGLMHVHRVVASLRSRLGTDVRIQLGTGLSPDFHTSGVFRLLAHRRTYCRAGRERIALDPVDNVLYPCMVLSGQPEYAIGHWDPVRKQAVLDPARNPLARLRTDVSALKGMCSPSECEYAPICRGGCRAMAAAASGGDLLAGQPACLTRVIDSI